MIAQKLWIDRNNCFYEIDQGNEMQDINGALTREYETGIGNIPSGYTHLVHSNLDTLLSQDPVTKQKWLESLWSARESQSGSQLHYDPEIRHNTFFIRN